MKSNYKKILFVLFVCIIGLININASNIIPKVNLGGFNVGDKSDFKISDAYDFSLISFTSDKDGKTITGRSDMKKIYSGTSDNYFTAYCMDGNKKYPEYEYFASKQSPEALIKYMTIFEILKECNAKESCKLFDNIQSISGYDITNIDEASTETITKFNNNETVTMTLSKILFIFRDLSYVQFSASELATALGKEVTDGKISVSFKRSDFIVNHYTASVMPDSVGYKKALWIIEHSYPTLDLDESLTYADVNINTLISELITLLKSKNPTAAKVCVEKNGVEVKCESQSSVSGNNVSINLEDYVYGTVQYAIWQVIGDFYELDGENKLYLGDTLIGSNELNKLYKYLIKDRDSYENNDYTANLYLEVPEKESYKSESNAEYYGPYKIKSKMLITNWNSLTATLISPKSGVTLVDKDLKELTSETVSDNKKYVIPSVVDDENNGYAEFYIRIDNSAKDTTAVNITLNATGKNYNNDANRGRLFFSESPLDQVVAVSASIIDVTATNEIRLEYNAKTGDFAFGTILLAVLGAFTIGYIALRFKGEPINNLN